jgi:hypothetical protein
MVSPDIQHAGGKHVSRQVGFKGEIDLVSLTLQVVGNVQAVDPVRMTGM